VRSVAVLAAGLALGAVASAAGADELRIAAASNAAPALEAVARTFEAETGQTAAVSAASTGKLYAQVVNGAPFDLLFAADAERPRRLETEGRAVAGSRFTYAIGRLVLWSADEALVDADGAVLRGDRFRHLALASPELAPYGLAARRTLETLGLWETLVGRRVVGENVGQALQFVATGAAELGFVAASQLAGPGGAALGGSRWEVPASLHPPIEQQAVVLRESPAARSFVELVRGERGRAILAAHGYGLP